MEGAVQHSSLISQLRQLLLPNWLVRLLLQLLVLVDLQLQCLEYHKFYSHLQDQLDHSKTGQDLIQANSQLQQLWQQLSQVQWQFLNNSSAKVQGICVIRNVSPVRTKLISHMYVIGNVTSWHICCTIHLHVKLNNSLMLTLYLLVKLWMIFFSLVTPTPRQALSASYSAESATSNKGASDASRQVWNLDTPYGDP